MSVLLLNFNNARLKFLACYYIKLKLAGFFFFFFLKPFFRFFHLYSSLILKLVYAVMFSIYNLKATDSLSFLLIHITLDGNPKKRFLDGVGIKVTFNTENIIALTTY